MFNWRQRRMHMPIGTIKNTTWAEASASPRQIALRVRPHSVARPRGVFLGTELTLLAAAVLEAVWKGATFEVPILIGCCAVAFYLKALDRSIADSTTSQFCSDLCEALCWGTAAGMLLLYAFPALGSRTGAAVAGVLLAGLLPLALRPLLRPIVAHNKLVEGMLIVGNGQLAAKLYQALTIGDSSQRSSSLLHFPGGPASGGITDFSCLPGILLRDRISRVIVAEQDAHNRSRLAATLVGPRLAGLRVNDAV